MKIELIKQILNHDTVDSVSFKYKPIKWCCDEIKENPLIEIVREYTVNPHDFSEDLEPSVAIKHTQIIYDWEDEYEQNDYYRINYCPFCGESIELSIVREEDVSEVLSGLEKERKEIWKKHNKTDSKKKAEELRELVRKLDNQINYFYGLCEYEEGDI